MGKKFEAKQLLGFLNKGTPGETSASRFKREPCVESCESRAHWTARGCYPHNIRHGDNECLSVNYADGNLGHRQLQRNWPFVCRRQNGRIGRDGVDYCAGPPLQIVASEADAVQAVSDYAGADAGKVAQRSVSKVGMCSAAAAIY